MKLKICVRKRKENLLKLQNNDLKHNSMKKTS